MLVELLIEILVALQDASLQTLEGLEEIFKLRLQVVDLLSQDVLLSFNTVSLYEKGVSGG